MTKTRHIRNFNAAQVVRYRLKAPDLFTPPRAHKRLNEREYAAPYEPRLELLDEMGAISVRDWGDG